MVSLGSSRDRNATIFVTGGAGFIGSAVIRHLLQETEAFIVNIDKLTYAASLDSIPLGAAGGRYRFAHMDICNGPGLRKLFEQYNPQYVMHLAAESHVDRSIADPGDFIQTNIVGTFTLLREALHFWRASDSSLQRRFRVHHVSTDEVYGSADRIGSFAEMARYGPSSPYAASKASSDHLVRAWYRTYGLPVIVTTCSNNYGPYQFPEKLIPNTTINCLLEQPVPIYGDGQHVRDWLYVDDHVRALSLIIEDGVVGETYNIGSRSERTNIDVVTTICHAIDNMVPSPNGPRARLITSVPDRPGHDRRYAIDPSKIEHALAWQPAEAFETGLIKTIQWYLENRQWWQPIIDRGNKAERMELAQQPCALE